MGRAAIPSRRYWKMKEEHERVVKLMEDLEKRHLGKGKRTPAESCGMGVKSLNRWKGLLLDSLKDGRK